MLRLHILFLLALYALFSPDGQEIEIVSVAGDRATITDGEVFIEYDNGIGNVQLRATSWPEQVTLHYLPPFSDRLESLHANRTTGGSLEHTEIVEGGRLRLVVDTSELRDEEEIGVGWIDAFRL